MPRESPERPDLGPCRWCGKPAVVTCDAEVPGRRGNGPMMATCDAPLCAACAAEEGAGCCTAQFYCPDHKE